MRKRCESLKKIEVEKGNAMNLFKFYFSQLSNYKISAFDKMVSLTILFQCTMTGNAYLG